MTTPSDAIFEVIDQFASSASPELRGNAVNALAALTASDDAAVASKAEQKLLGAITRPEGAPDASWRRSFVRRASQATNALPIELRTRLASGMIAALMWRSTVNAPARTPPRTCLTHS